MNSLKKLIKQWLEASLEDLDVWEVSIDVYEVNLQISNVD